MTATVCIINRRTSAEFAESETVIRQIKDFDMRNGILQLTGDGVVHLYALLPGDLVSVTEDHQA